MRRRVIEVELNGCASLVRGWGSRDLFVEVRGCAPVYVSGEPGGWSCQESTARDIVAMAESRNFDVVITGPRRSASTRSSGRGDLEVGVVDDEMSSTLNSDPGVGLW